MTDEIDPQDDGDDNGAARAFAELQAEVAVMRKAGAALPAAIEATQAPDYTPSLGALVKGLAAVDERMTAIAAHPALKLTPDEHASALEQAGADIMGRASSALRDAANAIKGEREKLATIVGEARTREAQNRLLLWVIPASVIAGLVLFPLLAAFAPGGTHLAALATGTADRWQAGVALMQVGNPADWRELVDATRLVNANTDALKACMDAATKAGTDQKCVIMVPVPRK